MTASELLPFRALDPLLGEPHVASLKGSHFLTELETLIHTKIQPPFCLSLNGTWGSGKTSLMKALEISLEEKNYPTLWFNPWEYERADDVVQCFLANLCRRAKNKWKVTAEKLGIFSLALFTSTVDAVAQVATNKAVSFKNVKDISDTVKNSLDERGARYDDPIKIVREDFATLTDAISQNHCSGAHPLVVFLDDLDRCLPDKALEMLEALKNLFVSEKARVIFIAGIDTDVAKRFIQKRYDGMESGYAANYFRKIFHATLNLPILGAEAQEKLITDRFDQLWKDEKPPLPGRNEVIKHIQTGMERYHVRSIRHCHNVLQNYYLWCKFHGTDADESEHMVALEFILLREKEPDLVQRLSNLMRALAPATTLLSFLEGLGKKDPKPELKPLNEYGWMKYDPDLDSAKQAVTIDALRWL
ncbi:KAP family P-loop NTPase fold protein [Acanthopleuribacter pedis]|uniref:KAP NTPase domain-containing protein n=1 Tax=Acanthopleuribacter pedis TaxID=442870 RepID=A0A8J7Q2L3_9BACT|nr:P-loop NTPase fold protein [Acanthopleuribacter pedis]MBO1317082.1 hypothetical protein [Acanthopleuribacter pedis]